MITIKSDREVEVMAAAGKILADTLTNVVASVETGVSTETLDQVAEDFIRKHPGARPSFKGLYGFPKSLCTSINNEIVHGIPSADRILRDGDILSIDCGVWLEGLHADSATTVIVGSGSDDAERLLAATRESLDAAPPYSSSRWFQARERKPDRM